MTYSISKYHLKKEKREKKDRTKKKEREIEKEKGILNIAIYFKNMLSCPFFNVIANISYNCNQFVLIPELIIFTSFFI